jgi:hypothetical protein
MTGAIDGRRAVVASEDGPSDSGARDVGDSGGKLAGAGGRDSFGFGAALGGDEGRHMAGFGGALGGADERTGFGGAFDSGEGRDTDGTLPSAGESSVALTGVAVESAGGCEIPIIVGLLECTECCGTLDASGGRDGSGFGGALDSAGGRDDAECSPTLMVGAVPTGAGALAAAFTGTLVDTGAFVDSGMSSQPESRSSSAWPSVPEAISVKVPELSLGWQRRASPS